MADFTVRPTAGTTTLEWSDTPVGDRPSRLNPAGQPHRYYRGVEGTPITLKATPRAAGDTGVEGEIDINLGGRAFTSWVGEMPASGTYSLTSVLGTSSVATFTPFTVGSYLVVFRRPGGGAVGIHIRVDAA